MALKWLLSSFTVTCLLAISLPFSETVDRHKFKSACNQSGFCERLRSYKPDSSPFKLLKESINATSVGVEGFLQNTQTQIVYSFLLQFLLDDTVRLRVNEAKTGCYRYQPLKALISEPHRNAFESIESQNDVLLYKMGTVSVKLYEFPFKLEAYRNDELVLVANDLGKFVFEHSRPRPETLDENTNKHGEWEEKWQEHTDVKKCGPMAVGMDFSFPAASHVYGLPSHADSVALKSTTSIEPYRLYNLDVFEYELNERMALYGAVPFIQAHGMNQTVGVFWLNSAETWVDVNKFSESLKANVVEKIVNLVSGGSTEEPKSGTNVHFISETGIVDVFLLLGPSFHEVTRQYSRLTGASPLPPYFSLGYHQSRWNYNDQDDVKAVNENFDKYDIPMDVMWLDIEYTHDKKYFTWDPVRFSNPTDMIRALEEKGRKLVVIIDPHIKRDSGYFLHNEATQKGYYVKNNNGNDYEGWCWPGSSSYLDFLNPEAGEYYASRYLLENFPGTTNNVYIWNDMNEPSVFTGPETTMPKDAVHAGNWEHRDVHNIYGLYQVMYTYEGLLKRSEGKKRPFVLSRAHFAGIQRYGAVWTGDNMASWEHLRASYPMCLSSALGGVSFCGADVGGFFGNPDRQLLTRWYQAGVYLPFFRAHAHIDTKRREPWLFDDETTQIIRAAIRERQALMPFFYTLFWEHMHSGVPVIRPLVMEFPAEKETFDIDSELLLGKSILVRPVTEPDVTAVDVYFPGTNEIWYNKYTYQQIKHNGVKSVPVTANEIPVYIRGGAIIPVRNRIRRASSLTVHDPFTLIVALDINGTASGLLYVDDGDNFDYRDNKYLYLRFTYLNNQLISQFASDGRYNTKAWIEKIVMVGIPNLFKKAIIRSDLSGEEELEVEYNTNEHTLSIRKPAISITEQWTITLL